MLITGANGFIAKKIARVLKEEGYFVIGTSRSPVSLPEYDEVIRGVLGEPLEDVFTNHKVDAVVHCAYDKDDLDNVKNTEGTLIWAEQAEENNVAQQIFMSSLSADKNAYSSYGQKKYEAEKWFMDHNHVVFRPGLVIGNGGLFGRIAATVKKSPVIPLIDNGKSFTYFTAVDTLSKVVCDTVTGKNDVTGYRVWYLQQESPVFFGDVLREIAKQFNLSRLFIPVPHFVVSLILGFSERVNIASIGINVNNLKGLRQHGQRKYQSDLKHLGYREDTIEIMIKNLMI